MEIGKNTFPYYLWNIHKSNYTGMLSVEKGKMWKKLYFENGLPVGAVSNLLNECLGALLVKSGKIRAEECEDALNHSRGNKKRLGQMLIERGFLSANDLEGLLKIQLKTRLTGLFSWKDCEFKFKEKEVRRITSLDEGVGAIFIEGARKMEGELTAELSRFKGSYLRKSGSFDSIMKELALVPLDLDGKSIEEVISCAGDVATFAYTMLLTGALTISGPDASELSGFYEKIKGKNHFEALGVEKSAGTPEIKSAFRRLARAYHPDFFEKNPEKQAVATKIFGIVAKAYGALSNEKERRKYIECLEKGAVDDSTVIFDKIVMAEDAFKKGKASLRLGNFAGARENFERAVEFNPEDGEICAYLGWTVFNTGKTPQDSARARELISNAIKMNGKLSMGYYFLGSIHRVEGDEEKALMFYEKALHLDPKLVEAQREVRLINMRRRKKKGFLGKFFKT